MISFLAEFLHWYRWTLMIQGCAIPFMLLLVLWLERKVTKT